MAQDGGPDADQPGMSDAEQQRAVESARNRATKAQGSMAGMMATQNPGAGEAKIPWTDILQGMLSTDMGTKQGEDHVTWSRLDRRSSMLGVSLPMTLASTPTVGVVVDTSGSMSRRDLAEAISEIAGIVDAIGGEVLVVTADTKMSEVYPVRSRSDVNALPLLGGGGTDMAHALIEAERKMTASGTALSSLICLTDGYTGWPREGQVTTPMIAAITSGNSAAGVPSFIQSVLI